MNLFYEKAKEKTLIVAHRGLSGGSILQNTIPAFKNALNQGADIIEFDIILSKDKKFFVFHHDQEEVLLHKNINIHDLNSEEINNLHLYNWIGLETEMKINSLDEVLNYFDNDLINIDRSWFYWEEMIDYLNERKNDKILLKSYSEEAKLKLLEDKGNNLPYMCIIRNKGDLEKCLKYDINLIAVEILFENLDNELLGKEMFEFYKERKLLTLVNAEKLSIEKRHNLSAGLDDNISIIKGPEYGWEKLISLGFNMIQTDFTYLLSKYINS